MRRTEVSRLKIRDIDSQRMMGADSKVRAESGEPYLDAPRLDPHGPRQSVLDKEVPFGTIFQSEIRP
jgi:hypothetical protein